MSLKRLALLVIAGVVFAASAIAVIEYRHSIRRWFGIRAGRRPPPPGVVETVAVIEATKPAAPAPPIKIEPGDWPWWRGPNRDGIADGPLPAKLDLEANLLWKVKIPGRAHASPILVGDLIVLAVGDTVEQTQGMVGLDRATSAIRWDTPLFTGKIGGMHSENSAASSTPACDGTSVFGLYQNDGGAWLVALDLSGKERWRKRVGPHQPQHGFSNSLIVHGDTLLIQSDTGAGGFLAAVHRASGEILWRVPRALGDSYGTPVVVRSGTRDLLIAAGGERVLAHDAATGAEVWSIQANTQAIGNTLVADPERVYVSGGWPEKRIDVLRHDPALGESVRMVWNDNRGTSVAYVPSPILNGNRLIILNDDGYLSCREAATGARIWQTRAPQGGYRSSPLLAGDRLYLASMSGVVAVVKLTDRSATVESKLDLGEPFFATPVGAGGRLYLRGESHLWCFGPKPPAG